MARFSATFDVTMLAAAAATLWMIQGTKKSVRNLLRHGHLRQSCVVIVY
jgi:hypothetical protein